MEVARIEDSVDKEAKQVANNYWELMYLRCPKKDSRYIKLSTNPSKEELHQALLSSALSKDKPPISQVVQ